MKKRIVSILLTLCMVLMLVPATAFAANDDATELQSLLNGGGTVTLSKDYTIDTTLVVTKNVTLDLNGHVIKMTGEGCGFIFNGKVTLMDSNPGATHTGENASLPAGGVITGGYVRITDYFTMNGGTIRPTNFEGVLVDENMYFIMNGGAIESSTANGDTRAFQLKKEGRIIANGGTVKGTVYFEHDGFIMPATSIDGCTKFYDPVTGGHDYQIISYGVYYGGITGGRVEGTYHTVSFDLNGGSGSIPTQYFVGIDTAPALKPADPTKEGDTFAGWFTDEALTTPYDFTSPVTENITLYAGFKPATYTVTYDGGEGEGGIASGTKTHGVDYTLSSETFTKDGFVQYGWEDKEGKFYKLGGVYSADADVTLYPVWDEIITVTAPFTTTVALGDNAEPDAKTFELMLLGNMGNELIFDDIKVTASVDTDGAGEYKGELTVTGPCRQLDKMLGEYAFVRQIDDGEENWTIDDTVWAVRFYQQEIAARSMSEVLYSLLIQPAYIKDTGDGLFYAVDINAEPLDEMSFTNVYTAHEHEYELKHDENGHWDECGCGDIQNKELHKYGDWKVTKEATQTAKGEKEHTCTICGYTETAEIAKLPATTEPTNPDTDTKPGTKPGKDNPATGDNSHMALWIALLLVSGAGVIGTTVYSRKKEQNKLI